jgi:prefoldin alpha subunit
MSTDKEEAAKLMSEYEYYKGQIEVLQEGIGLIDSSIFQLETTMQSLTGVGSLGEDNEILLPVGSDSFLRARITDTKNAIVGIGADVAATRSLKQALAELEGRKNELEKIRKERVEALEKTVEIAQKMAPKLQEMISKSEVEG